MLTAARRWVNGCEQIAVDKETEEVWMGVCLKAVDWVSVRNFMQRSFVLGSYPDQFWSHQLCFWVKQGFLPSLQYGSHRRRSERWCVYFCTGQVLRYLTNAAGQCCGQAREAQKLWLLPNRWARGRLERSKAQSDLSDPAWFIPLLLQTLVAVVLTLLALPPTWFFVLQLSLCNT